MKVKQTKKSDIYWYSYDYKGEEWFKAQISLMDFSAIKTSDKTKAAYLQKLLKGAVRLNSEFLSKWNGFDVKTYLEFPNDWGLGSSSSLCYLVAEWADVNPLLLHFEVSEGSGYDVACAGSECAIRYQIEDDTINYSEIDFEPGFLDSLYFVHLNEKVLSNEAIDFYFKKAKNRKSLARTLGELTDSIISSKTLSEFCGLIEEHEAILSKALDLPRIKDQRFSDFEGSIKSLGAWGGDFALVASKLNELEIKSYFKDKGYSTLITYADMIYSDEPVTKLSEV